MNTTSRMEIERAAYEAFLERMESGAYEGQRLGQAFYNHFRLYRLSDQTRLYELYEAKGKHAHAAINRLFKLD